MSCPAAWSRWPSGRCRWRPISRGRTLTIAEVEASEAGATVEGTIVGRVIGLAGNANGRLATVHDGTGSLDVWCPGPVCLWGPINGRSFEFDVVAAGGPAASDHLRRAHLLHETMSAAAELVAGIGPQGASAVASAVRLVD